MKVVIIEDEKPAALKLKNALERLDPSVSVDAILHSLHEAEEWLACHPMPDLFFMDIELTDGRSFELFDKVPVTCPVIFITAYDEYWQEAFEHNSIDYLLKPVKEEKLAAALSKYDTLKKYFSGNLSRMLRAGIGTSTETYKKRYLVKRGLDYVSIKTEDIAYFYATHKLVCMIDSTGQKYILDQSLAEIERQVDPEQFYRVNRKYLVNMNSIRRIKTFPKSKLQLELDPPVSEEIIISQENVSDFKEWMDR